MKLRNLILSLFLAAAFAACDGTTGPAGVAGGAGAAGPAGPAGDAGKAGDSADEVMRSYAYLKVWGKPEGKAACSDPVLRSKDPFPGPATLPELTASTTPAVRSTAPVSLIKGGPTAQNELGDSTATPPGNNLGKCSDAVFDSSAQNQVNAFVFTSLTNGTTDSSPMTETPRKGTTPTLRNATLTEVKKWFREGEIIVNLNNNGSEYTGRDLLFTRCDIGRVPLGGLKGKYRAIKITEDEYLLKTDAQGTTAKDIATKVTKTTSKICVRFSAPGAVKCYITETAEKRKTSDDKLDTTANSATVTEQIVLYKDGKMTPVDPKPNKMNRVPGVAPPAELGPSSANKSTERPFGGTANDPFITFLPAKLCNFFAGGVIGTAGAAAAAPSTGGGGSPGGGGGGTSADCTGTTSPARPNGRWTGSACVCDVHTSSELNSAGTMCQCRSGTSWRNPTQGDPRSGALACR